MTRVTVGPFNRVEGDLEVELDIAGDSVTEARVTTTLYRGFEQILVGRPPGDALVIAPRICGICSVSQSLAAAAALRAAQGVTPARNGVLATSIAHAAENLADHLTHFYLFFMPDFAREQYATRSWFVSVAARFRATRGTAAASVLPARARLLNIMGLIAGKWPHSLAFQPGGTTRALDLGERMRLVAILAEFRGFLESTVFAAPLEAVLTLRTADDLRAYAEGDGRAGDFAAYLRLAADLGHDRLGRVALPVMSLGAYASVDGALFPAGLLRPGATEAAPLDLAGVREDLSHAWMAGTETDPAKSDTVPDALKDGAYSWAKAPRLGGAPVEVGALARQMVAGQPLVRALVAGAGGSSVLARIVARFVELALVTEAALGWARALVPREPFCETGLATPQEAQAIGAVEAARGALAHWLTLRHGRIERYQIVAPTTWNFSPRDASGTPGPLEQALAGTELDGLGAKAAAVQHVIRSFDPCMVCTAH